MNVYDSLIGDVWNVHLVVMGLLLSMTTLLYASLCGKVEESDALKTSKDFSLMSRKIAINNSISKLGDLNNGIKKNLISFFIQFIITTIVKYLPKSCLCRNCCIILVTIIAVISMLYVAIILIPTIYSQYQKEIQLNK